MRSISSPSHLPSGTLVIRKLLLALLISSSAPQTGCVPYPNRFQENRDSGTEVSDASVDASTDTLDASLDADAAIMDAPMDSGPDSNLPDADVMMDAAIDAPDMDARIDTGTPDSGDVLDAATDSGPDTSIPDASDVMDAGDIVDAGRPDTGTDAGPDSGVIDASPDSGDVIDAGPATWPCTTGITVGPDIILPVTPGETAPFSVALTRAGRLAIAHLSGGHAYFTSVSADGSITYVATRDINPDLLTTEIGNGIAIGCSTAADNCLIAYVRSAPDELVNARINSTTGGRLGMENFVSSVANLTPYQVAFNSLNLTYAITYAQTSGPTPYQAFLGVTNSSGVVSRTTGLAEPLVAGTRADAPSVVSFGENNYFVAFQDSISGNAEIYTREVTAFAGVAGPVNRVTTTADQSIRPSARLFGNMSVGVTEYRVDWIESGTNLATRRFSGVTGAALSPMATTTIPGAGSALSLHSSGQFVAWYNGGELDVALFASTSGSTPDNQTIERSAFANFRPIIVSTDLFNGRIIYMMPGGNLHMRTLSCR